MKTEEMMRRLAFGTTLAAAGVCTPALASNVGLLFIEAGNNGALMSIDPALGVMTPLGDGTINWTLTDPFNGPGWQLTSATIIFNQDPFITSAFSMTNVSGSATDFVFSASTISADAIASPIIDGASDVDLVDSSDDATDAALVNNTTTGDAEYNAFIDGVDVRDLLDPISLSASFPFSDNAADSYAGELSAEPLDIGDVFGIRHEFNVTAGDTVTVNSSFVITPEPASLALVALGGLIGLRRRR